MADSTLLQLDSMLSKAERADIDSHVTARLHKGLWRVTITIGDSAVVAVGVTLGSAIAGATEAARIAIGAKS